MLDNFIYESVDDGRCSWSCRREGSGFCGYGPTMKDALQAFLDLEQDLAPITVAPRVLYAGGPFEPADYATGGYVDQGDYDYE